MNKKVLNAFLLFSLFSLVVLTLPVVTFALPSTLQGLVDGLASSLGGLGASLAVIGFVVAGIMYIASTANPSMMSVAKGALIAAIIGIVILILAPSAQSFVSGLFGS